MTAVDLPAPAVASYLDETASIAAAWDASRARSQQTEVGISELMGCRSALAFKLRGVWESDKTDTWRAIVGTAMHDWLTARRREANPALLFDVHVNYRGTPGTPDEVDTEGDRVAEWKFPRLSTSNLWKADPDAFLPKRAQAQGYAAALVDQGLVSEACTVVVAVMPVDGTYDDWWTHEEPFDRDLADMAAHRRESVEGMIARDELIPRDKPYTWCESYCEFFTLCRGASTPAEAEPITDPELAAAVRLYGETLDELRPLEKRKKELAGEIRGVRGTVGDPDAEGGAWRVTMTNPSGEKLVDDLDAVRAAYAERGESIPQKSVPTSSPSLRVARVKPAGQKGKK